MNPMDDFPAALGSTCLSVFESRLDASATALEDTALIVEGGQMHLSYGNLNKAADNLASNLLRFTSLGREADNEQTSLISILMHRHAALIVAMLGTMKAGAAYVPVDPSFPPDRQSYIFTHSQSSLLLADEESYQEALNLGVDLPHVIVLDKFGNVLSGLSTDENFPDTSDGVLLHHARDRQSRREKGGLQYVLYTSGSTGKPKGVMVPQHGVANLVAWFIRELHVGVGSKVLGLTTACFDISVLEIFMPLLSGGTLVLAQSASQKDPFRLLDLIKDTGVSIMQATPTTFEMMLAAGWCGDSNMHLLVNFILEL